MADVTYEPVKKALNRIKELSADEETRRLAFVRERALRDEVSLLSEAKREGRVEAKRETALNLIKRTEMDDAMIADIAGLTISQVTELRAETKH